MAGYARPSAQLRLDVADGPRRFTARYVENGHVVAVFAAGEAALVSALRHELEGDDVAVAAASRPAGGVRVDRPMCIGSGNCVRLARDVFRLDADGVAEVVDPAGALAQALVQAVHACPTGAISLEARRPAHR